ncbi:G-protein coupled receptor moody [Teleopsis dalmanni]|uniref:G-protein coupled receptor moody n=1 Tax=Teleopsis dalmanni TaxID=139649 RepID=UPI0018CE5E60|nr:G-protein coupled receptor moody [Teleopsis dalmanni]
MSEYSFIAFTDFEYSTDRSQNFLDLPISRFQPSKPANETNPNELNVPYTVFEVLVAIFAIIGNLMVIIVFQRERRLRRRTNYYIVSLAMADFLVGLLGVPFAVMASIGLPTNLYACLFTVSLLVMLCTISIFCLVAVSVDRYWAILYPMAYSRNVRTRTAIIIISMCWVAGIIVGLLPLFGWHASFGADQACLFVEVMDYDYLVFLYFATIITPAILMLAFYAHIYRVIIKQVRQITTMNPVGDSRRSSTAQIQTTAPTRCHGGTGTMLRVLGAARKRDVKATQNLSIIVLFFMICWIPLYTINCIMAFCPTCYVHPKLTLFCIILSHLNSAVNPVLYAYHLKDFRAALKNLVLKLMGVDIEQPVDNTIHRFSLASQHRLQSMDASCIRSSLHPRIYVDSPIWLRQQQQESLKCTQLTPKCGVVTPCLNNIHQTVAAVASVTANIERDIWNIMEASSGAEIGETSYEFPEDKDQQTPTPPPRRHRRSMPQTEQRSDSPYTYENRNYSTSPEEADFDEVFLPVVNSNGNGIDHKELHNSLVACALREKLRSDDTDYQDQQHSRQRALTDSSYSDMELPKQTPQSSPANGLLQKPTPPHTPTQNTLTHNNTLSATSQATSNTSLANSSIYVIDNDKHPLSPGRKPKFRKSPRLSVNLNKTTKGISRSCSCASDTTSPVKKAQDSEVQTATHSDSNSSSTLASVGDVRSNSNNNNSHTTNNLNYYTFHHPHQQQYKHKFSPLKAVSNYIFPPIVKHSSLFQLFQPNLSHENRSSAGNSISPLPTTTTVSETTRTQTQNNVNTTLGSTSTTTTDVPISPTSPTFMTTAES